MAEITLTTDSPEYAIIHGLKAKLRRIETIAERSLMGSPPKSKERALAVAILETMGKGLAIAEAPNSKALDKPIVPRV